MSNSQRIMGILFILLSLAIFGCQSVQKDFDEVAKVNTEQAYRDFIRNHADHPLAKEARKRLESIVFESLITKYQNRFKYENALVNFLTEFPDGPHLKEVNARLSQLRKALWPDLPSKFPNSTDDVKVTVKSLITVEDTLLRGFVELKAGEITIQPKGGTAMELTAALDEGKLIGYKFDVNQLRSLVAGDRIAIYKSAGWHIVTIATPLKGDVLGIEDVKQKMTTIAFHSSSGTGIIVTSPDTDVLETEDVKVVKETTVIVNKLRLIDGQGGKAGLVWDMRDMQ